MDDRSARTFAVKPAPSARRYAASGLTARPSKSGDRARRSEGTRVPGNVWQAAPQISSGQPADVRHEIVAVKPHMTEKLQ